MHLAGSGRAQANAASALEITLAGRGEVVHESSAQPHVAAIGSGTVRRGAWTRTAPVIGRARPRVGQRSLRLTPARRHA